MRTNARRALMHQHVGVAPYRTTPWATTVWSCLSSFSLLMTLSCTLVFYPSYYGAAVAPLRMVWSKTYKLTPTAAADGMMHERPRRDQPRQRIFDKLCPRTAMPVAEAARMRPRVFIHIFLDLTLSAQRSNSNSVFFGGVCLDRAPKRLPVQQ